MDDSRSFSGFRSAARGGRHEEGRSRSPVGARPVWRKVRRRPSGGTGLGPVCRSTRTRQGETRRRQRRDSIMAPAVAVVAAWLCMVAPASGQCEAAKLLASDGAANDAFGISLALEGNRALIGAHGVVERLGAVYFFEHDGRSWNERQKLFASDGHGGALFGNAVGLDGDAAVIGSAWFSRNGTLAGGVYVFRFDGQEWREVQKLFSSDGFAFDFFGHAVAIDGDVIVVGAAWHDTQGDDSGAVYVFRFNGQEWVEEAQLLDPEGAPRDWFGFSVAISGNVIAVGDRQDDDSGKDAGSAFVFRHDGQAWQPEAKLLAPDGRAGDSFGQSVALDGQMLIVGAHENDDNGRDAGAAYVYGFDQGGWALQAKLMSPGEARNSRFGQSVAVEDGRILIGAYSESGVGAAYVYERDGKSWSPTARLAATMGQPEDRLGWSVSLSADRALVGAHGDGTHGPTSGAAFEFSGLDVSCTGRERFVARCKRHGNGDTIMIRLKRAAPTRYLSIRVDSDPGSDRRLLVDCAGERRLAIRGVEPGGHTVEIVECGLSREVACP